MVPIISEFTPSVEDTQVVDILNIALLKVEIQCIFLREKMKSVEGFCLRFRDRRNVR